MQVADVTQTPLAVLNAEVLSSGGFAYKPIKSFITTAALALLTPIAGDRYIMLDGVNVNKIAQFNGLVWDYYTPTNGYSIVNNDDGKQYVYRATITNLVKWVAPAGGGEPGADGLSAYQVAVANGFAGTQAEWLLSLKGAKGDKGDDGSPGIQGLPGLQGLQGLKGDKGDTGAGVPAGGLSGQLLAKGSDADFHFVFINPPSGAGLTPDQLAAVQNASNPSAVNPFVTASVLGGYSATNHSHNIVTELAPGFMDSPDKIKLNGIASGATVNQTDAYLLDRTHHTGVQEITTINGLADALAAKQPLSSILSSTTASFLTAHETKLGFVTITQAVDLDFIEARVNQLDQAVLLVGGWDASSGVFPGGGTAQHGHEYIVTTAGTVDGVVFNLNDMIIAITDNASTTTYAGNWIKRNNNQQVVTVFGRMGAVVAQAGDYNTTLVTEGTNLYFTQARAIASPLTGFSIAGSRTAIVSTDTILQAFGKAQKYFNDLSALSFSGDGADLINASVTNSKLSNMAFSTIKGRAAAGTGVPEDLSAAQVRIILNVEDGANNYSHPTGDGNLHVPPTGTTNDGKVLTAGLTPGSLSWQTPSAGGGGGSWTPTVISANTTLTTENFIIADTSGGSITLTLPASPVNGQEIIIIKSGTAESTVARIERNGTQLIGQALTFWELTERNEFVHLTYYSAGGLWKVVARPTFSALGFRKRGTTGSRYYTSPQTGTALTTGAPAVNILHAMPFVIENAVTIDQISINVTTGGTSSNTRVGIYSDLNNQPDKLIVDAGAISTATSGIKTYTTGLPISLPPGLYWLVCVCNGTAPTLRCHTVASLIPVMGFDSTLGTANGFGWQANFTYAALPATFPTASLAVKTAIPLPAIFVRFLE